MTLSNWPLRWGTLCLGLLFALGTPVSPIKADDDQPEAQEGVDVQGRGPVHEAFADPAVNRPASPVVAKKPPEPIEEMPPDQKPEGDNVFWLPGYWAFDDDTQDFLWVSGCWRAIPPGKQWMPGHWTDVQNGYQWVSGFWAAAGQEEAALVPEPPAPLEAGPSSPAPSPDNVYVPGSWVYQTSRFFWRPGFWYIPQPNWLWVPARYVWTPGGWIFVDGYWDYPLARRGLLFAPVVIDRRYWGRPRWVYRPSVIIYDRALVGCLFVRPRYGSYYFGDYFDARYRRQGFVAWVNYRPTRFTNDPLFSATRWEHRRDPAWSRNLNTLYVNRYDGRAVRPARTLVQQNTVIKSTSLTNIKNVTVMAPITRVDKTVVKLQPVTAAQHAQEQKSVQQLRSISVQRQRITAQATPKAPTTVRPVDRPAKVALPRVNPAIKPQVTIKPPALPPAARAKPLPQKEAKPIPKPVTPPPAKPVTPPPAKPVKPPPAKPVTPPPAKPVTPPPAKPVTPPPAKPVTPPPARTVTPPPARTVTPPPPRTVTPPPPPPPKTVTPPPAKSGTQPPKKDGKS